MPPSRPLQACRSCRHLGRWSARGKPAFKIGNELFGVGASGDGTAAFAKSAHGRDISRDLARLAHGLRIVAGEHELGQRKFLQAEAHPVFAEFGGAVRTGPAGNVVIQGTIEIVIEWLTRTPPVARDLRGAKLLARLEAKDAAAIAADAAGEMRKLNLQ